LTLKYPQFPVRLKKRGPQTLIFDSVRRKWLVLTPEEWVRQHLINFLVTVKKFPASSIAVEKELALNDLKRRFDIVVYDNQLRPYLIVECKAPYVPLSPVVIEQTLRYNLTIKAPLLMISNGINDYIFNSMNQEVELPQQMPL
jgi:type I site-specific restriction endonuclease